MGETSLCTVKRLESGLQKKGGQCIPGQWWKLVAIIMYHCWEHYNNARPEGLFDFPKS